MIVKKVLTGYMLENNLHTPKVGDCWISTDSDAFVVTSLKMAKKFYNDTSAIWTGIYRVKGENIHVQQKIGQSILIKDPSKMMVVKEVYNDIIKLKEQTKRDNKIKCK
ncbi:MAG: hypothetical protein LBF37_00635 [Rickettsiales bacterium]|jgi:hypothetical protein|nr:hypothetical protein [Rickettsiales bacterium]